MIDEELLRRGFSNFPTGVTVTTMMTEDMHPVGFTANSFSSVSLSPGMVLFSKMRGVRHYVDFAESEYFGINVLAWGQEHISDRFSSDIDDRFEGVDWNEGESGVPILEGSLVWFECSRVRTIEAGDHSIILGRVLYMGGEGLEKRDREALGYYRGSYLRVGSVK